jgi:clan AA aspartic protease (TIGR02281 family)
MTARKATAAAAALLGIAALVEPATAIELNCSQPTVTAGEAGGQNSRIISSFVRHTDAGWTVWHTLANGQIVDRAQQYAMQDSGVPGGTSWIGRSVRHPNQSMIGMIPTEPEGHHYIESLYDNPRSLNPSYEATSECSTVPVIASPPTPDAVPFEDNHHGTLAVDAVINGSITAKMVIDTGATHVLISRAVADALLRNGSLSLPDDIIGRGTAVLADGRTIAALVVHLHSLTVGGKTANDITADIAESPDAEMLLGQSFLKKFASWSIDNRNRQLQLR